MGLTRIFISYTSRDEISKRVSKTLFDRLQKAGFAAWRDEQRLKAGEKWHGALTQNLIGCHAGVIVLSAEALKSEWVLKEATYLKVRGESSDYKVLTVLLDDVQPEHLTAENCRFKVLHFNEDQLIQKPEKKIAGVVIDALQDVKRRWDSPRADQQLIDRATEKLALLQESVLLRMARSMKLELKDWFPDGSMKQTLARELAQLMAHHGPPSAAQAMGQEIENINPADAAKILKYITPLQVNGDGAERLAEIAARIPPGGAAGLNAKDAAMSTLYLRRAAGGMVWPQLPINGWDDPEGHGTDVVEEVRRALRQKLSLDVEDDLAEEVAALPTPYFVTVPASMTATTVQQLKQQFDSLCFFVHWPDLEPTAPICGPGLLEFLAPRLDDKEEERILQERRRGKTHLEQYENTANQS